MESVSDVFAFWLTTTCWIAGLAVVFGLFSHLRPVNPGMHWWQDRRAVVTDLVYWFVMPLILRLFRLLMVFTLAAALIGVENTTELESFFLNGYGPLSELDLWVQALMILALADFMMYWLHRGYHTNFAWRYHAIHHSPKVLDWMSTQRFHPINLLIGSVAVDVVILGLGFSPAAFVLLSPFNIGFSAFVHSNIRWDFGPFKAWLASPIFHRWHHTSVDRGGASNFAPTFPILDVIFGTFYMPEGELPDKYGVSDPDFPEGVWAQLLYPFKK